MYLLLTALSAVLLLPLMYMFSTSLQVPGKELSVPPKWFPAPIMWRNYPDTFSVRPFHLYLRNTLIVVVGAASGTLLTASMAGYAFARLRFTGRSVLFGITLMTMMLPYIVTMIPTFIIFRSLGWINTLYPLFVPAWFGGGAFNIFLFRQFFMTLPYELDEAARIDGAGFFRIYARVLAPISQPVFATVAIFSFISHWNEFMGPLIYLNSRHWFTLALGLQTFRSEYEVRWANIMVASTLMTVPCLLVFFFFQRYFLRGVVMSGISGR
ncbi:MAG: carbohydrate ABC transporter permease [Anaerolineae bacterium]|nr:carbohydrate ABC transporter permease [Anaerolineae bacterium]